MFNLFPISTEIELQDTLLSENIVMVGAIQNHSVVPSVKYFIKYNKVKNTIICIPTNDIMHIKTISYYLNNFNEDVYQKFNITEYDFDRMYEFFRMVSQDKLYGVFCD